MSATAVAAPGPPGPDPATFVAVAPHWWVSGLGGLALSGVVAARSGRRFPKIAFVGGVALHVGEAAYSYHLARQAGFNASANKWFLQTLGVGFPSLTALRQSIVASV